MGERNCSRHLRDGKESTAQAMIKTFHFVGVQPESTET